MLRPIRDSLSSHWEAILNWLTSQIQSISECIASAFQEICSEIQGKCIFADRRPWSLYLINSLPPAHIQLAPHALQNMVRSMNSRQRCIQDHVQNSLWSLFDKTEYELPQTVSLKDSMTHHIHRLLQRDMLHGHPSSFISGLMHPAYISCQIEFGMSTPPGKGNLASRSPQRF